MSGAYLAWPSASLASGWQGIKRLDLDIDSKTLTIHLAAAPLAPFTPFDLIVTGGRRIRDLRWKLVDENTAAPRLILEQLGDQSPYTVTLLGGGGRPIDPFFASASFVFTVDCERDDCRPTTVVAERPPPAAPTLDLLTKDYDGFVRLLSERVKVINPHWADLSPASLERVLLELLSHQADMLSYYQDRVANEAFVEDATQRHSLRQHGVMLGYDLFDGSAAETELAFTGVTAPIGFLPAGLSFARDGGPDEAPVVFYLIDEVEVREAHNALAPAAWPGATDAEIPADATRLLLWGHGLELTPGRRVAFIDDNFCQIVTLGSATERSLPGWVRDPADAAPANPLTAPSLVTDIVWDAPLAQAIRPWRADARDEASGVFIRGNLARARHGEARSEVVKLAELPLERDRQNVVLVREPRRLDRAVVRLVSSGNVFPATALAGKRLVVGVSYDGGATFPDLRTHLFGAVAADGIVSLVDDVRNDGAFLGGPNPDLAVLGQGNELCIQSVVGGGSIALQVDGASTALGANGLGFSVGQRAVPELRDDVILLRALRVRNGPVTFARTSGASPTSPIIDVGTGDASADSGTEVWTRVDHLHNSASFERHFAATADEDGSLWLHFGDGRQGAALEVEPGPEPSATRAVFLSYRAGDPIAGNCAPRTLTRIGPEPIPERVQLLGAKLGVTNLEPGRGGRQPETREAARLAIPASLRHGSPQRAVSLDDYAQAARQVPGVTRAAARALGGPFNTVLVLVDPADAADLSPALRDAVSERIDAVRMAGREHFVRQPDYVPLDVKLGLCTEPGALPHRVRELVHAALRPGTSLRPGFFHPDRLSFGESVERGDVLAVVQAIPGVRSVKALVFKRLRELEGKPTVSRVLLGPTEVARLDGDVDRPEHGRLEVLIVGIDAEITEKDFDIVEAA